MRLPHIPLLGLVAQFSFHSSSPDPVYRVVSTPARYAKFELKDGRDRFNPEDAIALVRPGQGHANRAGDLVFVSASEYSFKEDRNLHSLFLASLEYSATPFEIPLPQGGEAFWLNDRTVGFVSVNEEDATSSLRAITVSSSSTNITIQPPVVLGNFPTTSVANFRYSSSAGVLVFSDNVYPDGNLTDVRRQDEEWQRRGTSALVYEEAFERHWDIWKGPKKASLFTVRLWQDSGKKWHFGEEFVNVLHGTGHHTPVGPFGGTGDFDVSDRHIVYTAPDPSLPDGLYSKQNIYIIELTGNARLRELTSGNHAATSNPRFNPAGDKVVWLQQERDGYYADNPKIVIYDLITDVRFTFARSWDHFPETVAFSSDSSWLYLTAGDRARTLIFAVAVPPTPVSADHHPSALHHHTPQPLTSSGSASGIQVLPNGRLLITHATLQHPNDIFVLHGLEEKNGSLMVNHTQRITRFSDKALEKKHLTALEEFWFEGGEGKSVHGYVLKPKGWKAGQKKRYPVVLVIYGGPQGVWDDNWSTIWNNNVFAHQGYFTVAINPTGSTTFGQKFADAIFEDWGGKPFIDLVKGWKHVLNKYPEIDADRAVAAGMSWGGYAINWIQGHPELGFNFKALVSHAGIFSPSYASYATDELPYYTHEWGGHSWEPAVRERFCKQSPHEFVDRWETPMLLTHGGRDYRVPHTESIAAFHALRQRGVPSRLVVFPDANHLVPGYADSLKWYYEVFRWFDLYVGREGEGAGGI